MDLPRYRTGDAALDAEIARLVEMVEPGHSDELLFEMVVTALRLARDGANRGDLKIVNRALKEMRYAFSVFAPYRAARKASIFGSARTREDDPLYDQARSLAAALAGRGWMVVTGAGPGIMAAGIEGAGPENAFGVSIRLPFEASTTAFLADDPKLVHFQYFFTRKLSFVKESDAFVLLPGGFGTLDEAFETLTLIQTGKAQPAPIVLLDVPGGTYWTRWREFVEAELLDRGYLSPTDLDLLLITDDVAEAVAECVALLRQLPLDALRRARPRAAGPTRAGRGAPRAAERGVRRPPHVGRRSPRRVPRRARSATATSSTSTGWCCASTGTTGRGSGA